MIFYKNSKAMVHSPDSNTDNFNIVTGILQGDTLAPFRLIIFLDYVLRTSIGQFKENRLSIKRQEIKDITQKQLLMQTMQMN